MNKLLALAISLAIISIAFNAWCDYHKAKAKDLYNDPYLNTPAIEPIESDSVYV
jgi:hypothetical protein